MSDRRAVSNSNFKDIRAIHKWMDRDCRKGIENVIDEILNLRIT